MPLFTKKPVTIEVRQWTGDNAMELMNWGRRAIIQDADTFVIETLEGDHIASLNDWIICGVHGELYPCKPDIFEKTYSPA